MRKVWTPRPDQQAVLDWIEHEPRAMLCCPTGAGKTVITATDLASRMFDSFEVARALVVAPPLVCQGWLDELAKWEHLSVFAASDTRALVADDFDMCAGVAVTAKTQGKTKTRTLPKHEAAQYSPDEFDLRATQMTFRDKKSTKQRLLAYRERLHVVSWTWWPWLAKALGVNWPYDAVVFDESTRLRDLSSDAGTAARHVLRGVNRPPAVVRLLTATPAANNVEAARSQMDLLEPGCLGATLTEFRETFCRPKSKNWSTGQVYKWELHPEMQSAFEAIVARRSISVPSALSVPLVTSGHKIALKNATKAAYASLEAAGVVEGRVAGSEAVKHLWLRELANGFVYKDQAGERDAVQFGDEKMDWLAEFVESNEGKLLVAFEFEEQWRRLKKRFGKRVRDIREPGAKDAFVSGGLQILALHPRSAGHGVDGLQAVCNQVVWLCPTEDAELWTQTNGRIHRTGTGAATVFVHVLVAAGTIEEGIYKETVPDKLQAQASLLSAMAVQHKIAA